MRNLDWTPIFDVGLSRQHHEAIRNAPSHALFLQGEMKAASANVLRILGRLVAILLGLRWSSALRPLIWRRMQEGEQLTIQSPDPEFEEILLSCAGWLGVGN